MLNMSQLCSSEGIPPWQAASGRHLLQQAGSAYFLLSDITMGLGKLGRALRYGRYSVLCVRKSQTKQILFGLRFDRLEHCLQVQVRSWGLPLLSVRPASSSEHGSCVETFTASAPRYAPWHMAVFYSVSHTHTRTHAQIGRAHV